ncbi:MAG: hypothetical protein COA38_01320 [Fluviicola sp.]|nr:MAG: hypothetical protein COA38_01320 [Fluviicola sp.]
MKINSFQKLLMALLCITLFSNCGDSNKAEIVNLDGTPYLSDFVTEPTFTLSHAVPHDILDTIMAYPANISIKHLSRFAWKEFVALNWPADPNHRGKPDTSKVFGDSSSNVVWETYWHRAEMFPYDENPVKTTLREGGHVSYKANTTDKPSYKYDPASFTFKGSFGGTGTATGDSTLFNNLSENNELDIDQMFVGTATDENRILYEAKMNESGFNYIIEKELYNSTTRNTYTTTSKITANLLQYGSSCNVTEPNITCLPCGDNAGDEGNIEIKASWRKLTTAEIDSANYYTNTVITYRSVHNERKYFNETYGLIALHIIHKTENFPSFIYATFEHKDLIDSKLLYIDEITQDNRGGGDTYGDTIPVTDRVHPIPSAVDSVNNEVHAVFGADNVFSNYKLVGVQAYPVDFGDLDTNSTDSVSTFYLANLAIETNQELQSFRGTKAANEPNAKNVYSKRKFINMGGCMGCHGVAQSRKGSDFNFLIANAPFTVPEFVGGAGRINIRSINSYADVQSMFDDYVRFNGLGGKVQGSSPHKAFWSSLSYDDFTTGNVPGVGGVKICDCGNADSSNIYNILKGSITGGYPRMPGGGPFFPEAQIDSFGVWINNNCPKIKPTTH